MCCVIYSQEEGGAGFYSRAHFEALALPDVAHLWPMLNDILQQAKKKEACEWNHQQLKVDYWVYSVIIHEEDDVTAGNHHVDGRRSQRKKKKKRKYDEHFTRSASSCCRLQKQQQQRPLQQQHEQCV